MYSVTEQLIDFFQFIMIGIVISLIFDMFRAYRAIKHRKSAFSVMLQDIIYFTIVTCIIVASIVYILDSNLRFYIFIAIIIGICVYISLLSKVFLKLYKFFMKEMINFNNFLISPLKLHLQIITKIFKFFKKNIKKCCKIISNVLCYLHKSTAKKTQIHKEEVWLFDEKW